MKTFKKHGITVKIETKGAFDFITVTGPEEQVNAFVELYNSHDWQSRCLPSMNQPLFRF